jgi:hypothetical protein
MPIYQKFILGILAIITVLAIVGLGVIIGPNISFIFFPPTKTILILPAAYFETSISMSSPTYKTTPTFDASSTNTSTPTERPTPTTRVLLSTWTPVATRKPIASLTNAPRNYRAGPVPGGSACSTQYAYAESLHQYYLDSISSSYDSTIAYYESLKQAALEQMDGLKMFRIDEDIARVKADRDLAINTENSRYASDRAYLDTLCK